MEQDFKVPNGRGQDAKVGRADFRVLRFGGIGPPVSSGYLSCSTRVNALVGIFGGLNKHLQSMGVLDSNRGGPVRPSPSAFSLGGHELAET